MLDFRPLKENLYIYAVALLDGPEPVVKWDEVQSWFLRRQKRSPVKATPLSINQNEITPSPDVSKKTARPDASDIKKANETTRCLKVHSLSIWSLDDNEGGDNEVFAILICNAEYYYTTKVNEKIDIYSFGVVLLELVIGKEAQIGDEHTNLAEWALRRFNEGHPINDVLDKEVMELCYLEEMTNVFKIGFMCTSASPAFRPSMKEVLQMLQQHSILEGSGEAKAKNERDVSPLLGRDNYISSCKNSKRTVEDDDYDMV